MAEELTTALERRAERGSPRGATAVFAEAALEVAADNERLPSWRRGPAIAFATAAVMLLVVGGVLLGSRLLVSESVAPAESATPASTTAIRVEELVWSRVPVNDEIFEDARINSVTVHNGRLVAVGEADGPAVWTSPDGLVWSRVSLEEVVANAPAWRIPQLSPGGPGLVAIVEDDMVWTSVDGVRWTPFEQAFDGQHEAITAMEQGGPGLIVVGDGMVYTSVDGTEWVAGQCPDCSGSGEFGHLADVAAAGPGLVAVGNARDWGGPASFWTSPDGLSWSRVENNELAELEGVAAGGPEFVAVGHSARGAVVFTSPDGVDWTEVPYDEEVFGRSRMSSVIAAGDGLVALGEWEWGDAQAWTSRDGITWLRVPYDATVFGESSINDVVVFGDRIVAVGSTRNPEGGEHAAVWIAAEDGSVTPPTTVAPESDSRGLVTGEAINPWRTTEINEPWARDVADVAALPEGGFAVASRYGGGVFWTRDGVSWQDANPDGLAVLPVWPDDDDLRVMTALPGRVAVLDSSEPAVWLGDLDTGEWDSIALDWEDTVPFFDRMVIASSDEEILVAGRYADREDRDGATLVWLIDPDTGVADRVALPPGFAESAGTWSQSGLEVAWYGDRWVVAAGDSTAVSEDGRMWVTNRDEDGLASGDRSIVSLTASPGGLMATSCEWAHRAWYSEDGLEWTETQAIPGHHYGFAYSDTLGFVLVDERVFTSADGRKWAWTLGPQLGRNVIDLAASGNSVFVLAGSPFVMTLE